MKAIDPRKQREFAVAVVRQLRDHGFEAYWAGGCVRDYLLQRIPKDYDVATSAHPEQIRAVFKHRKTLAIGAAFGVMTVVGPRGAGHVEVTTFRQDVSYSDGRHPDRIQFSSAQEDAQRRDFTINGMFYDPLANQIIDFVGGEADLRAAVVRAIGDASARFTEDKLRMLRAVRFASIFDFHLEENTLAAIRNMAAQATVVSAERIADEMRLMLAHKSRATTVRLLQSTGLLSAILPEVMSFIDTPSWQSRVEYALQTLGEASFSLATAVLLELPYELDKTVGDSVGNHWRLSRAEIDRINWLLENRIALIGAHQRAWSEVQPLLSHEGARELVVFHACRRGIQQEDLEYCRKQVARSPIDLNPSPLITGDDLIALGISPGPIFASLLRIARDAQLDGEVTDRQSALALVQKWRQIGPPH